MTTTTCGRKYWLCPICGNGWANRTASQTCCEDERARRDKIARDRKRRVEKRDAERKRRLIDAHNKFKKALK